MDLSIVVSSFNRAGDLTRFLDSLGRMEVPGRQTWEVIVVDNNSTDETRQVVERAATGCEDQVRYLFEPRQGKSFALNTALSRVRGRIVAFTDDDAIVRPDWVRSIIDFFDRHPDAVCVGGKVELFNPADAPTSTRVSETASVIGLRNFSAVYIPIIGCNMAFRTSLLGQIGAFDTDIGPGSKFGVAEDLDYLYRIVRANHLINYEPSISLFHNHGRRTPEDLKRLYHNYFTGRGAFYCKHVLKGDTYMLRLIWWEVRRYVGWKTLRAMFDRDAREDALHLWTLMRGALRYLLLRGSLKA
jgi:glycosyltransferase involved in cell wall biosynthesis